VFCVTTAKSLDPSRARVQPPAKIFRFAGCWTQTITDSSRPASHLEWHTAIVTNAWRL